MRYSTSELSVLQRLSPSHHLVKFLTGRGWEEKESVSPGCRRFMKRSANRECEFFIDPDYCDYYKYLEKAVDTIAEAHDISRFELLALLNGGWMPLSYKICIQDNRFHFSQRNGGG